MVLTKIKSSREATLISIYLPPRQTQVTRRVSDDFDDLVLTQTLVPCYDQAPCNLQRAVRDWYFRCCISITDSSVNC